MEILFILMVVGLCIIYMGRKARQVVDLYKKGEIGFETFFLHTIGI